MRFRTVAVIVLLYLVAIVVQTMTSPGRTAVASEELTGYRLVRPWGPFAGWNPKMLFIAGRI